MTSEADIEMSMYFELLRTHTQSTQTRATHTDTYSLTTRTHSVNPLYYLSNTRSKWQRTHYSGPGVWVGTEILKYLYLNSYSYLLKLLSTDLEYSRI